MAGMEICHRSSEQRPKMLRETLENESLQEKCPCDCSHTEVLAQLKQLVKIADKK